MFLRTSVEESLGFVEKAFGSTGYVVAPEWFAQTAPTHTPQVAPGRKERFNPMVRMPFQSGNPQTDIILDRLGLRHVAPVTIPFALHQHLGELTAAAVSTATADGNEIDIGHCGIGVVGVAAEDLGGEDENALDID